MCAPSRAARTTANTDAAMRSGGNSVFTSMKVATEVNRVRSATHRATKNTGARKRGARRGVTRASPRMSSPSQITDGSANDATRSRVTPRPARANVHAHAR